MSFSLTIRLSNGNRFAVTIDSNASTILQVKQAVADSQTDTPVERQRLIYKGRILENEKTLKDYDIAHQSTLFLVKSSPGAANKKSTSTPAATSTTTATTSTPAVPSTSSASGFSSNTNSGSTSTFPSQPSPWSTFGGLPTSNSNSSNSTNPMAAMPGMPNMDPQQMQSLLNSPMMRDLVDNPQLIQSLMQSQMQHNPAMRQMLDENPHLQHILNDPSVMQQAMRMMRDPSSMQQAMRQQDLAMSQLENMPGGFAALSNMYHNIQQPMEEAMSNNRQGNDTTTSTIRSDSTEGAAGAAMPNPWGSPAPAPAVNNNTASNSSNSATVSNNNNNNNNNNTASSALDDSLIQSLLSGNGLGGGNSNGMSSMLSPGGQMPNPDQMMQLLDNPMVQQMTQQALQSNPGMFRQMLEQQNPMMRQLFQNDPAAGDRFVQQMMDPANMRNMLQLQQQLGGTTGSGMNNMGGMPNFGSGMSDNINNNSAANSLDFGSLLQQLQSTGLSSSSSQPPQNPADQYRVQLRSLYDMGFDDEQRNLRALSMAHGNLNRAVDLLLSGQVPDTAGDSS